VGAGERVAQDVAPAGHFHKPPGEAIVPLLCQERSIGAWVMGVGEGAEGKRRKREGGEDGELQVYEMEEMRLGLMTVNAAEAIDRVLLLETPVTDQ
jgi:hypothetical protein